MVLSPKCQSCSQDENEYHFLQCKNKARVKYQREIPEKLQLVFKKHNTNPDIHKSIIQLTDTKSTTMDSNNSDVATNLFLQ